MNCPISVVDVGSASVAQARNSSIWRGDSRPVPPFRSNRTIASTPPSWNSLSQMRIVESSRNSASATSVYDQPLSSRRMAFARRTMRCSSSPSLTIFIRSARSVGLRKLRFVFTRRVESIPLIRSNDFRKGAESRYKYPPAKPGALGLGPLKGAHSQPLTTSHEDTLVAGHLITLSGPITVGEEPALAESMGARLQGLVFFVRARRTDARAYRRKCQTSTATPAKPGDLP